MGAPRTRHLPEDGTAWSLPRSHLHAVGEAETPAAAVWSAWPEIQVEGSLINHFPEFPLSPGVLMGASSWYFCQNRKALSACQQEPGSSQHYFLSFFFFGTRARIKYMFLSFPTLTISTSWNGWRGWKVMFCLFLILFSANSDMEMWLLHPLVYLQYQLLHEKKWRQK